MVQKKDRLAAVFGMSRPFINHRTTTISGQFYTDSSSVYALRFQDTVGETVACSC